MHHTIIYSCHNKKNMIPYNSSWGGFGSPPFSVFLGAVYSSPFSSLGFAFTIRLISSKISCSLCPFSSHHSMTSLISALSISSICSPFSLSGYCQVLFLLTIILYQVWHYLSTLILVFLYLFFFAL